VTAGSTPKRVRGEGAGGKIPIAGPRTAGNRGKDLGRTPERGQNEPGRHRNFARGAHAAWPPRRFFL